MIPSEWIEIVDWIGKRFPDHPWAAEQALAFYDDLAEFDASDVWSGLYSLYEEGQRFAPNGSQLLKAARSERRREARPDQNALPETTEDRVSDVWRKVSETKFGEVVSFQEAIERIHAERPCKTRTCPIHYPEKVTS